jgi:hypothetical protein
MPVPTSSVDLPADKAVLPGAEPIRAVHQSLCANCGAVVLGKYCSACGQRVELHSHSLWSFLAEFGEALTHADSRLWRTLGPLLFRPGFLTRQFLNGHRASYLPPLRLYLVFSVLFFLIFSFTGPVSTRSVNENAAVERIASELLKESESGRTPRGSNAQVGTALADPGAIAEHARVEKLCIEAVTRMPGADWIRQPFLSACQRTHADQSRALGRSFVHNLGRAMFLFLPLLAALITPMYSRAGHYYVDNLLLLVHNQALVFLLMSIYLLASHWTHSGTLTTLLRYALLCYIPYYFYRSMQTVYVESWIRTLLKFGALALGYLMFGACAVFLAGLYSAAML